MTPMTRLINPYSQTDMQMSEDEGDEGAQSNVGEDEVDPQEEEELSEKEDELEEEVCLLLTA